MQHRTPVLRAGVRCVSARPDRSIAAGASEGLTRPWNDAGMVRPLPAGLLLFALAACGSSSGASSRAAASGGSASCRAGSSSARPSGAGSCASTSGGSSAAATTATLHVMAAASLSKAMPLIAQKFEADHPGVHVQFNFAGSADLIAQLKAGAPADVLATADQPTMTKVASLVSNPLPFASTTS